MKTNVFFRGACAAALMLCCHSGFAQLSGTINVGAGQTYTSLTGTGGFFEAINSQGMSGNVTAAIVSDLTETGAVVLNDFTSGGTNNVRLAIVPDGTTERLISGSSTLSLIKFSGVRNLKIDGSFAGDQAAHLRFRNASTGASSQTMTFALGCTMDTVAYCFIEGSNNATTVASLATVVMIDATTTGNNNLVFKNNTFSNPVTATA